MTASISGVGSCTVTAQVSRISYTSASGVVTKEFLIQYKVEISAWKPWLKYAVTAVIAILDMLDGVN